jgi:hypothetical protein
MSRLLSLHALASIGSLALLAACASTLTPASKGKIPEIPLGPMPAFQAQVVGIQWLNPLQRRDYSTEWQLLWTLGLAGPNTNDDMVKKKPAKYSAPQSIGSIVSGFDGETFEGFHHKYVRSLIYAFHDIYFSSSRYFYNAHSLKDKSTRRELAGIRIEYSLPDRKLDPLEASTFTRDCITEAFAIGNSNFRTAWTRDTPPDVRVTAGGPNAGFTSLSAALDYLQKHPIETVWAMSWDAPNFPPKADQLNENMTLLVLAGPRLDRLPNHPRHHELRRKERSAASPNPGLVGSHRRCRQRRRQGSHRHRLRHPRCQHLARPIIRPYRRPGADVDDGRTGLRLQQAELQHPRPARRHGRGIGTDDANHLGKNVLVAGTTDRSRPTAVMLIPPEKPRPINPEADWFRARSEATAYLMWWGLRHDAQPYMQGYSE